MENQVNLIQWEDFAKKVEQQKADGYREGISYIISGSLALLGGVLGVNITDDSIEKGIYTVFQTLGVASVGYGAYLWKVGDQDRMVYQTLQGTQFNLKQKTEFIRAYDLEKKERDRQNRWIRTITHGLIAGLNFYNASLQKDEMIKNGLYFVGGINLLAAVSFTVEF